MSLTPTVTNPSITTPTLTPPSELSLTPPHTKPTGVCTPTSPPASRIKLFNRPKHNSPFTPDSRSAQSSPYASPYTEPSLRIRSTTASPIAASLGEELLASLTKAAESGNADAQFDLAMSYSFGKGVKQNFEAALGWFVKCANQGNARAQYFLGAMYSNGHGTNVDLNQAHSWYIKSANQGDTDAQFDLGVMYLNGMGVEKNESAAFSYLLKAAEKNHVEAQLNLALMYQVGEGTEKDTSQAIIWYRKAAEQGDEDAQVQLQYIFSDNLDNEKDRAEAVLWYQQAAERNLKFAQKFLINCYTTGQGLNQDLKIATYWALRLGLEKGTSITMSEDHLNLIQFIPGVLKEFIEFEKVRKLVIQKHHISDENFTSLSEFIQSDTSIELLDMTAIQLDDTAGSKIVQALKTNITLTDFFADSTQINAAIADEIQINLNRNINISEACQYLRNHKLVSTYNLPLPTVFTSGDKLIISMLKNGQSLGATKLAVDKLLTDLILTSKE
jgi:TPR repeat protein